MRELKLGSRITARSLPEIIEAMENFLSRQKATRELTYKFGQKRAISNEVFVNAAILHLLEMEPGEAVEILRRTIGRLEEIVASDEPTAIEPRPAARPSIAPEYPTNPAAVGWSVGEPPKPKRRGKTAS